VVLESEAPKPPVAKAPATPRGSRLDPDWVLPKAWGDWAVAEMRWHPDQIRLEADKFADFWHSKAGANAVKLDWLKTWRNWCRNAKGPAVVGRPGSVVDVEARNAEAKRLLFGDDREVIDV